MKSSLLAAGLVVPMCVTLASPAQAVAAPVGGVATPVAVSQGASEAAVVRHYSDLVHAAYTDTLQAARDMQVAIEAFLAQPSPQTLQRARQEWREAREYYGQTEAFRFYGGPIDEPEARINAWPLDEAYIDSVQGKPDAGLINQPRFKLSKAALIQANERGGEENISTGWHAIEFLLWGQDFNEAGSGDRSHEDYVVGVGRNAQRRAQYLRLVTELLIDDLSALQRAWAPGQRNYRARFERGGRDSIRKILVGLGSLSRGELAGERLEVALNTQDQEDEHSCFSDNTHRDAVTNALGIENVWWGRYLRRDGSVLQGPSLREWVAERDSQLAQRVTDQIAESVRLAQAIPAPFDRAILKGSPGREVIERTVASLVAQSQLIVEAAQVMGIRKLTLVQP